MRPKPHFFCVHRCAKWVSNNAARLDLIDRNHQWATLRFVFEQHRSRLAVQDPSEVHAQVSAPRQPNKALASQQNFQAELQAVFVFRGLHGSPPAFRLAFVILHFERNETGNLKSLLYYVQISSYANDSP